MSSNYSAGQYNDAFSPKRLGNWQVATERNYNQHPRLNHRGRIDFLADENGHLLPGVQKPESYSTWGCLYDCYNQNCSCPKKGRKKAALESNNKRYQIPKFYKKKKKSEENTMPRPQAARKMIDPYLNYLRDLQLPTIWIIGMPTDSIKEIRKGIAQKIANDLSFCYIDLDDQILKWTHRMNEMVYKKRCDTLKSCMKQPSNSNTNPTGPVYRSQKVKHKPIVTEDKIEENSKSRKKELKIVDGNLPSICDAITFDTSEYFTTDAILDLIKFAMIEGLPCRGFVLDGFPCNLEEAGEFERMFYPSALGMYFTAGTLTTISGFKIEQHHHQYNNNVTKTPDPIANTRRFSRKHPFCLRSGQQICKEYGRKVVRVIETENVDKDTIDFINDLVRKNLDKYPEILAGKGKIDCNPDDNEDDDGDSPCASALNSKAILLENSSGIVSRSSSTAGSSHKTASGSDNDDDVDEEPDTNDMINLPPPLVSCSDTNEISTSEAEECHQHQQLSTKGKEDLDLAKRLENLHSTVQTAFNIQTSTQKESNEVNTNVNDKNKVSTCKLPIIEEQEQSEEMEVKITSLPSLSPQNIMNLPADLDDGHLPVIPVSGLGCPLEYASANPPNWDETETRDQLEDETIWDFGAYGDRPYLENQPIVDFEFISSIEMEEMHDWYDQTTEERVVPAVIQDKPDDKPTEFLTEDEELNENEGDRGDVFVNL